VAGRDKTSKPRGFTTEHQPVVSRMPLTLPGSQAAVTGPGTVPHFRVLVHATLSFVQSDMARSSCRLGMHSCTRLASMLAVAFGPEQACLPLPLTVG
jgi:hypothetical protein